MLQLLHLLVTLVPFFVHASEHLCLALESVPIRFRVAQLFSKQFRLLFLLRRFSSFCFRQSRMSDCNLRICLLVACLVFSAAARWPSFSAIKNGSSTTRLLCRPTPFASGEACTQVGRHGSPTQTWTSSFPAWSCRSPASFPAAFLPLSGAQSSSSRSLARATF